MNTLMHTLTQRLVAALPLALVAACGSSPSSTASNSDAMVYASSARSPSSIASCLKDRLSNVHESHDGNATELAVGSRSDASYFVTLTPNGYGSVIRVTHGASGSSNPPEEEMRFDIARCTT
jgi:putative salt-induced outer membrane protein YdiY